MMVVIGSIYTLVLLSITSLAAQFVCVVEGNGENDAQKDGEDDCNFDNQVLNIDVDFGFLFWTCIGESFLIRALVIGH